jgi:hypothetical protein
MTGNPMEFGGMPRHIGVEWDRRRILTSSGALAAAGITSALLPSAALAASVGLPFNSFSSSVIITPTSLPGLTSTRTGFTPLDSAYGIWEVPDGVTRVEVVAVGTSGGPAGIDWGVGQPSPSPFTGVPGRGARIVASLTVTPGHRLVIAFSGSERRDGKSGGYGGSAAAVGDLGAGSSGEWLLVAGGGGGAGQAGIAGISLEYANGTTAEFLGGDGGDAGTEGNAAAGGAGSGTTAVSTSSIGQGGGGATTSAVGTGGTGTSGNTGTAGTTSLGPTSLSGSTMVGQGGALYNNTASGGGGGGGLFGGGSGGPTGFNGAAGGGGGGASFLRTSRVAGDRQNSIELVDRSVLDGPGINLYF